MYVTDYIENYIEYDRMKVLGGMMMDYVGKPEVPQIIVQLCVPQCSDIQISTSPLNTLYFSGYLAYPVPDMIWIEEQEISYWDEEFYKDDIAYNTSGNYPSDVALVSEVEYFREQPSIAVKIRPILNDPVTQQLTVYQTLRVTVSFVSGVGDVVRELPGFEDVGQIMFLNRGNNQMDIWDPYTQGECSWLNGDEWGQNVNCHYLVIVADPFHDFTPSKEKLEQWAAHRAAMNGIKVRLVRHGNIRVDDEPIERDDFYGLWSYIDNIYDCGFGRDRLRYLLIVGDAYFDQCIQLNDGDEWLEDHDEAMIATAYRDDDYRIVRHRNGWEQRVYLQNNDYYFSRLDGNNPEAAMSWKCQVPFGRLSVGTHDELDMVIDKIIDYETTDNVNYRNNLFYVCGEYSGGELSYSAFKDWQFELMSATVPGDFHTTYLYPYAEYFQFGGDFDETIEVAEDDDHDNEQARGEILDQLETESETDGCLIKYYSGHGAQNDRLEYGFFRPAGDPGIPEVENSHQLPLILLSSCWNGEFNFNSNLEENKKYDGFAEILTIKNVHGGIGVVAAPRPILPYHAAYGCAMSDVLRRYYPNRDGMVCGNFIQATFNHNLMINFEIPDDPPGQWIEGQRNDFRGSYTFIGEPGINLNWNTSNISGNIEEDETWSGKIFITGNVTVVDGVTLTIEPKTEVVFMGGDWDLKVEGRIVADGESDINHILFRSFFNDKTGCVWISNSDGNGEGNTVRYCEFTGMYTGLYISNSEVLCEHNKAHDCFNGIAFFKCDDFIITDVECYDNTYGLKVGHEISEGQIVQANCLNNETAGFRAYMGGQNIIELSDCQINANGSYGVWTDAVTWVDLVRTEMQNNGIALKATSDACPWLGELNVLRNSVPGPEFELYNATIWLVNNHNDIVPWDEEDGLIAKDRTVPFPGHNMNGNYLGPPGFLGTDRFDPDDDGWIFNDVDDEQNVDGVDEDDEVEDAIFAAATLARNGDYREGYDAFREIIEEYPNSYYSLNALNGLYYCAGRANIFDIGIRRFCLELAENSPNRGMQARASRFATRAYVTLGMYEEAIQEYENRLRNEENRADSIFTAMELAHAFFLMRGDDRPRQQSFNKMEHSPFTDLIVENFRDYSAKLHQLGLLLNEIDSPSESTIPDEFFLSQNYPNPFNSVTHIRYGLKDNAKVNLKIYNVLGREVRSLLAEEQKAGYYSVIWDGTNNSGISVSSGMYFYRIETGSFTKSCKLILMK